jgi:hypothetical protein
MSLHIFLGDEELLYFVVRVEVTENQICFEFKLVCNLQKGLKIYKGFSIFPKPYWTEFLVSAQPASSHARPDRPSKAAPRGPASLAGAHPSRVARSDPITLNLTRC